MFRSSFLVFMVTLFFVAGSAQAAGVFQLDAMSDPGLERIRSVYANALDSCNGNDCNAETGYVFGYAFQRHSDREALHAIVKQAIEKTFFDYFNDRQSEVSVTEISKKSPATVELALASAIAYLYVPAPQYNRIERMLPELVRSSTRGSHMRIFSGYIDRPRTGSNFIAIVNSRMEEILVFGSIHEK